MKYIIQFILGGGIIVAMNFFAQYSQPKISAIIYSLPIQFTIAIVFIYLGQGEKTINEVSKYSVYSLIGVILFILTFLLMSKYYSFFLSLGISYLLFICCVFLIFKYL